MKQYLAQSAVDFVVLQCTGVVAERKASTNWCCLVDENPVLVTNGTNVLYRRKDAWPQCEFGYDRRTGCSECVQGKGERWSGLARIGNSQVEINFRFKFRGANCSLLRDKQFLLPSAT